MKKFFALFLMAIPMVFAMTSCDDDDDLPNVSMSIEVENAVYSGSDIYVVQGDTMEVLNVNIRNNEADHMAAIYRCQFRFGNIFTFDQVVQPYRFYLPTSADQQSKDYIPVGEYPFIIYCDIAAEDKALAIATLVYTVHIVASETDIPADAVDGTIPTAISDMTEGQLGNNTGK